MAGSGGWRMLWSAAGQRPGVGGVGGEGGTKPACVCVLPESAAQTAHTAGNSRGLLT